MRLGRLQDAYQGLKQGVEKCGFPSHRAFFQNALTILQMQLSQKQEALKTVETILSKTPVATLIRSFVFFENDCLELGKAAVNEVPESVQNPLASTRTALVRKYIEKHSDAFSMNWFIDQFADMLAIAA